MQWVDGVDKTGSDGFGNKGLGTKPGGYESILKKGLRSQMYRELELEQQLASQELIHETQKA